MAELPPVDARDPDAPLHGARVVEIAGELTGYAGRLLADLGADVTRVRLRGVETREPTLPVAAVDAEEWFLHRGKRTVEVEAEELCGVLTGADVVLSWAGADAPECAALEPEAIRRAAPTAVHVQLTPFGLDGPAAGYVSADLVRLAAGGLLWLGGYPDGAPVAPFGHQSTQATGIYGAVAALLALIERDSTGAGRTLQVSSQEVITQALETSIPEFEFNGRVQRRLGSTPREAGTGVYPCADGFVSMVAGRLGTAEAWTRLREWLVETGTPGAEELWHDEWNELAFRQRPESIVRFAEIFGTFTATRGKEALYIEAQRRRIALAPVNDVEEVLRDEQLNARRFFIPDVHESGLAGLVPAPPFRFSALATP
jgi:benzylsuccinate CoA-transferase BbsE subunit